MRVGDLRAKLTSLALVITLENGELVDCRALIVACVFVMFVNVALCLPFQWGFLWKTAYCALRASVDILYCNPNSSGWPGLDDHSVIFRCWCPCCLSASGFSLFKPEGTTKLNHLSVSSFLQIVLKFPLLLNYATCVHSIAYSCFAFCGFLIFRCL